MVAIVIIGSASFSYQQLQEKKEDALAPQVGVRDELFVKTTGLNAFFLRNIRLRNAFLIICSFMMDVCMLVGLFRFATIGNSWRIILAGVMFYGLRFTI